MKRHLRGWLLGAGLAAGVTGHAPAVNGQEAGQVLNVDSADIRAFIQDVARVTGRVFVVDPRVEGTVTIAAGGALTDEQVFEVFLATLRANGFAAVPTASGALRITLDDDAARFPAGSGSDRFVTQVIRLKSKNAAALVEVIKPLLGAGGQVSAAPGANALVVSDFGDNVRRLNGLLADLDRDADAIEIVSLKNSRAAVLADSLKEIADLSAGGDGAPSGAVSITAVEASNAVVIRGPTDAAARLRLIAATLDEEAKPTGDTRVIFLQHTDATQVIELVETLLGQPRRARSDAAAPANAAPDAQRGSVALFPSANALVVKADPVVLQEIDSVVRQLDRRSEQVLVEAIVVEVTDTAAKDLGVQFLLSGDAEKDLPFFATNYSDVAPNLLTLSAALAGERNLDADSGFLEDLRTAAVQSLLTARGGVGGLATDLGGDGLFGAIVSAVKRDTGSNLLSTPSIMTLNNKEATILVGQDVPITTGEALSGNNNNPFRTIQRQDIGIKLEVRPQINADGAITLFLRQEVSNIAPPVSGLFGELVFNKREIETTVLVDDGDVIVLGGLLDQGDRRAQEKVPLLGDIPFLGNLFRSRSRDQFQTNLMVFIRPTVVGGVREARAATQPRFERMTTLQRAFDGRGESSLEDLVRKHFPTAAIPAAPQPAASAAAAAGPSAESPSPGPAPAEEAPPAPAPAAGPVTAPSP